MSSTNGGPSVTTTPNVVVQAVPAGSSSVPFDPSSVAITGGTIAGSPVSGFSGSVISASVPVVIANAKDGAANIYWTHPLAGVADSYTVTNITTGASVSVTGNPSVPSQSYSWPGLTNGVAYSFSVTPVVSGASGVAATTNTVTPTSLLVTTNSADLAYWFSASQIAGPPGNGSSVTTMADFSGNGRTATLASGATAATFLASWNSSKPALTMSNSAYVLPITASDLSSQLSIIAVSDYTGGTSSGARLISNHTGGGDSQGFNIDMFASGSQAYRALNQPGTGGSTANITTSTPYVVSCQFQGSIYLNGTKTATLLAAANASKEKVVIGALYAKSAGTFGSYFTGRIAEMLVFRGSLSQAERWAWEAALATKYGMSAPAQQ